MNKPTASSELNLAFSPYAKQQFEQLNSKNYVSLIDAFEQSCSEFADKIAFNGLGQNLTFSELNSKSRDFAAYLLNDCGLEYGDRVAIQLPNILQYPVVAWGVLRAGLVIVNTNPLYTPHEMAHQFNDSGAKLVIVLSDFLPKLESIIKEVGIERVIVTTVMDVIQAQPAPKSSITNIVTYLDAINKGKTYQLPVLIFDMHDLAVLQYTGGTTGVAKGAMLSQGNIFAATHMGTAPFKDITPESEISIAPMPLYHIYGFCVHLVSIVLNGGKSVLIPNPRDLDALINTMKAFPFTGFAGINTLFAGLMQHPEFDSIDFSHLKITIAGGSTLVVDIANEWERRTGNTITEGYGLSETAASATVNRPDDIFIGSVGKKLDYMQVKTIDEEGNDLAIGVVGELVLRGPQVMYGYWQRPEATAKILDKEGWFRTGDVALIQEDGFIKIVDRIKDMILVSGFNVYPNEIEAVVYTHPDIIECAAIGVTDDKTGEAVRLYLVSKNPDLSEEQVIKFCREKLTAYKVPKQIVFQNELPKSAVGKILRRVLRDSVNSPI